MLAHKEAQAKLVYLAFHLIDPPITQNYDVRELPVPVLQRPKGIPKRLLSQGRHARDPFADAFLQELEVRHRRRVVMPDRQSFDQLFAASVILPHLEQNNPEIVVSGGRVACHLELLESAFQVTAPVQPSRSLRCGQSVGTSTKLPRCPHSMLCWSWLISGSEQLKLPVGAMSECTTTPVIVSRAGVPVSPLSST